MPLIKRKKPSLYNSYPWAEVNRTLAGLNFGPQQWSNFAPQDVNSWMNMVPQAGGPGAPSFPAATCQSPVPFQQSAWPPQYAAASAPFCQSPVFGMNPAGYAPQPPPMFSYPQYPQMNVAPPPPPPQPAQQQMQQPYGANRAYVATPPPYPGMMAQAPPAPTGYAANWGKQ